MLICYDHARPMYIYILVTLTESGVIQAECIFYLHLIICITHANGTVIFTGPSESRKTTPCNQTMIPLKKYPPPIETTAVPL